MTTQDREKFEAWCPFDTIKENGVYAAQVTQDMWDAWQAALQSQSCVSKTAESKTQAPLIVETDSQAEPVIYQCRMRPDWGQRNWTEWKECSRAIFEEYKKVPRLHDWVFESRALYSTPPATQSPDMKATLVKCVDALKAAWGCLDAGTLNTLRQVEAAIAEAEKVL